MRRKEYDTNSLSLQDGHNTKATRIDNKGTITANRKQYKLLITQYGYNVKAITIPIPEQYQSEKLIKTDTIPRHS